MTLPSSDTLASALLVNAFEVANVGYWDAPPGPLVYHVVNRLTGQSYVGATVDFVRRVREHHAAAEKGRSRSPLYCAMRKCGMGAFVFVPIEYFADEAAMKQGEKDSIRLLRTQDRAIGYNVADGGDGLGSAGAKAVHQRPEYRGPWWERRFERAAKAAATRAMRTANGYYEQRRLAARGR